MFFFASLFFLPRFVLIGFFLLRLSRFVTRGFEHAIKQIAKILSASNFFLGLVFLAPLAPMPIVDVQTTFAFV
jgi:hypothetical protein